MRTFEYVRASQVSDALASGERAGAAYLAGGTTQVDLMKDGVLAPERLVDITRLPLRGVLNTGSSLHVGALTTMEELAADPVVTHRLPVVREALLLGASVQLRNMATIGGNLLQRARCRYFRDPTVTACNKRTPGSGCAAITGPARMHAILGVSERCIALHASDLAVALVALDALVHIEGAGGTRSVPLTEFYVEAGATPEIETVLAHGELITAVEIPLLPETACSGYLKVRDRVSYEFALVSVVSVRSRGGLWRPRRCCGAHRRPRRATARPRRLWSPGRGPSPAPRSRLSWRNGRWSGSS
jgi:CO/xanthine dehydrogenase FAD-binding subunit